MTPRISFGVTTTIALVVPASGNVTKKLAIETHVRASSALGEKASIARKIADMVAPAMATFRAAAV